jgi:hypothetical protein
MAGRKPEPDAAAIAAANPLSEDDAYYLRELFAHKRDIFALAEHTRQPLHLLLSWLAQPHIQAHLEMSTQMVDDAMRLAALDCLAKIARTSPDPVERRRAAVSIAKAVGPGKAVPPPEPPGTDLPPRRG